MYADTNSVTLSWLPPLSAGHSNKVCNRCDSTRRLTQYADSAVMTGSDRLAISVNRMYGPEHATGKFYFV